VEGAGASGPVVSVLALRTVLCLHAGCDHGSCADLAHKIHAQLDEPKYRDGISLMPMPESLAEWRAEHRTARKRADRAARLGYEFADISYADFNDDIHAINTSKHVRQGRPMSTGYFQRHNHGRLPEYPCDLHAIRTYGVLKDGTLVAYMTLYRVGDLSLVSMILGHGDHLANDIMYLLFAGMISRHAGEGGWLFYNRHDSGTDGLVYFKERLGFRAADIEWSLA
jgi:hypothetical protein